MGPVCVSLRLADVGSLLALQHYEILRVGFDKLGASDSQPHLTSNIENPVSKSELTAKRIRRPHDISTPVKFPYPPIGNRQMNFAGSVPSLPAAGRQHQRSNIYDPTSNSPLPDSSFYIEHFTFFSWVKSNACPSQLAKMGVSGCEFSFVSCHWWLHPISNAHHPTSNIQHPTSTIHHPPSNIQHPPSNIHHQTSNSRVQPIPPSKGQAGERKLLACLIINW